jgi:hypothetical protein
VDAVVVVGTAVVEAGTIAGLASELLLAAGVLVESETAADGDAAAIVPAVGVASDSAGVVWALAGSAVNNKTSARTMLLERLVSIPV